MCATTKKAIPGGGTPRERRVSPGRERGGNANLQRRRLRLHMGIAHRHETHRNEKMNLAQKIQKNRRARGLTQEEFAAALNVSHQSVSKWESGQATPGLDKVLLMSEFFQVSTDYLLKEDTDAPAMPPLLIPLAPVSPVTPVASTPADAGEAKLPAKPETTPYALRTGVVLAATGCAGLILLWALALLNPPYTFDKQLGPVNLFSFYVRYHELERHLMLAIAATLAGFALIAVHRFRKNLRTTAGGKIR
ncbi:MAG: hypothetical protein DELT_02714 [Desulfovibrio sp.]